MWSIADKRINFGVGDPACALTDASIGNGKLYRIDESSGEIFTKTELTGKGRRAPYALIVRAIDSGSPQLFTDTEVYVTVGDVSSNDGVPSFISPVSGKDVASVPENSPPGTRVFQVEATDPDDPQTANGKLVYRGVIIAALMS